jgi:TPR repeat protein
VRYVKGQGVPQDNQVANFWLLLAAAQGHKGAEILFNVGKQDMSQKQLAAVQDAVLNEKPKTAAQSSRPAWLRSIFSMLKIDN